jgi:sugar (pentulose or hexulose) kinase
MATEGILIFDVGKTNKKLVVFDKHYNVLEEQSTHLEETVDEDGFACEDVALLTRWIKDSFLNILSRTDFTIKAVNFSGYGASFVCVDEKLKPVIALSNYLKPYPESIQRSLYDRYGGKSLFSKVCASPSLGSLNSGLQLYRLRQENPEALKKIRWALHLPQYLSSILTGRAYSEMTSIGCHTCLWDFTRQNYHSWVLEEKIDLILPEIRPGNHVETMEDDKHKVFAGIGLHDSSAALIPYLATFNEPFILLSTGTWNISLNPFNQTPLTEPELDQDCLCYFSFEGKRVKASRLFAGHEHDMKVKELGDQFRVNESFFLSLKFDTTGTLNSTESAAIAYLHFMKDLVKRQAASLRLVQGPENIQRIFVDGGFSRNSVFMNLLANIFPLVKIFAASVPQASALGAAIAIHSKWNPASMPQSLIDLKQIDINSTK